jgi:hypothetical protein
LNVIYAPSALDADSTVNIANDPIWHCGAAVSSTNKDEDRDTNDAREGDEGNDERDLCHSRTEVLTSCDHWQSLSKLK